MNLVDSSGWLEYFADGPNANFFAPAIRDADNLIVPSICLYEVYKRVRQLVGETAAARSVGDMVRGRVVDLDTALALDAARISSEARLPMADSIIWATARYFGATLWTQDAHFQGLPDVKLIGKTSG